MNMPTKKATTEAKTKKDWGTNKDGSPRKQRSPSIPMKVFATALNKGYRREDKQTQVDGSEKTTRMIDYNDTFAYLDSTLGFTPTEASIRGRLRKVNDTLQAADQPYTFEFIRRGRGGSRSMSSSEVAAMFGAGFKKGK